MLSWRGTLSPCTTWGGRWSTPPPHGAGVPATQAPSVRGMRNLMTATCSSLWSCQTISSQCRPYETRTVTVTLHLRSLCLWIISQSYIESITVTYFFFICYHYAGSVHESFQVGGAVTIQSRSLWSFVFQWSLYANSYSYMDTEWVGSNSGRAITARTEWPKSFIAGLLPRISDSILAMSTSQRRLGSESQPAAAGASNVNL